MFRAVIFVFMAQFATAELPKPAVAATANGEEIPLARVDAYIKTKLAVIPVTEAQLKELRKEVVSDLIDDALLKQFLAKNAPKVELAEIDRQLVAFTAALARKGKTLAQFLAETKQTETELKESWTTLMQLDAYARKTVTDEQLKAYYLANKDHFDRVELNASHILIRVSPSASQLEKAVAKEKLQALRQSIASGKIEFAAAARKHSQCPSAIEGGRLGWLTRKAGIMDEAFCKAAFKLKSGEVSDAVETDIGLHLILITERKAGTPSKFEKCIDLVRETYADELRPELVAKLRKEATIRITLP